jgi:hypothetical protein
VLTRLAIVAALIILIPIALLVLIAGGCVWVFTGRRI